MEYIYSREQQHLLPQLREIAETCYEEHRIAGIPSAYRRHMNTMVSKADYLTRHGRKIDPRIIAQFAFAAQHEGPLLPRLGFNPYNQRTAVSLAHVNPYLLNDLDKTIRITIGVQNSTGRLPRVLELMPEFSETQLDLLMVQAHEIGEVDKFIGKMPDL